MKIDFSNRTVLITGGARGIGASLSQHFLKSGAQVIIVGKEAESFHKFEKENQSLQSQLQFRQCDLLNPKQVDEIVGWLKGQIIDVLVNNAGINKINKTHDVSVDDFDRIQFLNVRVPFLLSQACLVSMRKQKYGRIVNMASIFGTQTKAQRVSYTTSKAALIGMTKTMAVDYADEGILVNSISPGFIDTELTRTVLKSQELSDLIQTVPVKRLGDAAEIAKFVLFVASELNSFMTGQDLAVDGGVSVV